MTALRPTHAGSPIKFPDINHRKARTIGSAIADAVLRSISLLAGASIIAVLALSVIDHGELAGPHAALICALAAGGVAGSIICTRATRMAACVIILSLLCGEAFSILSTSERIIAQRADTQSKVGSANDQGPKAMARLEKAEAARGQFTSEARQTVVLKSCRSECRTLLETQLRSLDNEVSAARAALSNAPTKKSTTPMADLIGIESPTLDLISAALLSFGANILGATLVGWGARPCELAQVVTHTEPLDQLMQLPRIEVVDEPEVRAIQAVDHGPAPDDNCVLPSPQISLRTAGVLRLIQSEGGSVVGPQRQISKRLGVPQSSLNRALAEARDAGLIDLASDRVGGTTIRLRRAR